MKREGITVRRRIVLITLLILFGFSAIAEGQDEDTAKIIREDVFCLNWVNYDASDDYYGWGALQANFQWKISKYFAYEFRASPFRTVTFRETDKYYIVATPLIPLSALAFLTYSSLLIPGDGPGFLVYILPLATIPTGTHFAFRPVRGFQVFAGMIPDVILFTGDDGILLQFQAGVRIYSPAGFKVNLKMVHYKPVIFEKYKKSSTGFGIEVGYNFKDFSRCNKRQLASLRK